MSKATHTTGPWEFWVDSFDRDEAEEDQRYVVGKDAQRHDPEDTPWMYASVAENVTKKNAVLIAAAPDLLAACERALITRACDVETRDMLRAAITRATAE